MTAALTAPMVDAAPNDDTSILAMVMLRDGDIVTWVSPAAHANLRVQDWCHHALDGGKRYDVFTMADLMALPPIG